MIAGTYVLVEEFYSNGLEILVELKRTFWYYTDTKFQGQRDFWSVLREASHRLLVEVQGHKLLVKKPPVIVWLKVLYLLEKSCTSNEMCAHRQTKRNVPIQEKMKKSNCWVWRQKTKPFFLHVKTNVNIESAVNPYLF